MREHGHPRPWAPPLLALLVLGTTGVIYDLAPRLVATAALPLYGLTLLLGPGIAFAWLRLRGTAAPTAVAAGLVPLLAWIGKECAAVARIYGVLQGLYYALNPIALGLLGAASLQMVLAESFVRRRTRGRWVLGGVPAVVLLALAGAAVTCTIVAQRYGVTQIHYAYIAGYRRLFGN